MFSIDLGTIQVTTGERRSLALTCYVPANRTIFVTLVAEIDPSSIERKLGQIEFANCSFRALFDQKELGPRAMLYTDSSVVQWINDYLKSKGFNGTVGWSEFGRQEPGLADFDMHYDLVEQFWPELRVEA